MTQAICDGLIVLDKPTGMTSRAAVDRAARWFPRRTRIGHTGTLDPLATGVLVICVGNATRLAEYVQRMSKAYRSCFRLGARSDTDDADGAVTPLPAVTLPDAASIAVALREFVGTIEQVPPAFSATKVTGRRAYSLARQGEEVQLQARPVQIHAIDVIRYEYPTLEVEVHCGKGTYIRSLARDLGERLGCGAFVQELRRTRVGPFVAEAAVPLDSAADVARSRLLPAAMAVGELPQITLTPNDARCLCQGQAVGLTDLRVAGLENKPCCSVAVFDPARHLMAVAEYDPALRLLRPTKVLAPNC
jgi:tRNA pseudouridine55 synthase